MAVLFHKMHGTGNDFVLLDLRHQAFTLDAGIARQLADRHTGIGCDQLLVLRQPTSDGLAASFEVWNADGSRAEQCGNGVRCIGLYLAMQGEAAGSIQLGGPAAIISLALQDDGQVRVDMGCPEFDPASIPVGLAPQNGWYRLETGRGTVEVGAVSMGNPHATVLLEDNSPEQVRAWGPLVSTHPAFPRGCNAGFARVIDRSTVDVRIYERGSGETLSCGSGACATAAILQRAGLVDRRVEIRQEGGKLMIEWAGADTPIMMTGPAKYVFQGNLE